MKTLGIIAGHGVFPLAVAQAARRDGFRVVVVAHQGVSLPELDGAADRVTWIRIGELGRLIGAFKEEGASDVVMAGGIPKTSLFGNARPDFRALALLARVGVKKDDALLRALADELGGEGIRVRSATELLPGLLAPKGAISSRRPTAREEQDIEYGWGLAKEIGRLDIGQCVVVKDRAVLAIEAIEGTDEAIRRGGKLGGGGAVVVKICKPQQDVRFDLPAVGPKTIEVMIEAGASALAVEAGLAILLDRDALVRRSDAAGIAFVGC